MGTCSDCGKPTKDNYEKCITCSKKDRDKFDANLIKGRIAESLIEQLFLRLDFSVFRYGMENTVPGVMKFLARDKSSAANNIKRMPDFVVQDNSPNSNHKVYFIEVKFRGNGNFDKFEDDFKKHGDFNEYPYKECFFIVVSRKHINCISYEELKKGEKITDDSKNYYLADRKEFALTSRRETVRDFCNLATKFFQNV